jgi:hypothetical protein
MHAIRLHLELYCLNQANNSPTTTLIELCCSGLHSTTQVVSRLHVTVLGKSCVVKIDIYRIYTLLILNVDVKYYKSAESNSPKLNKDDTCK